MKKSLLKKGIVIAILLWFMGAGALPYTVMGTPTTWKVNDNGGGNFDNIKDALLAAGTGDTIEVYTGTYVGDIVVDESIYLLGIDYDLVTSDIGKPIIYGSGSGDVVTINADDVTISGFIIQNSGNDYYDANIKIWANNIIITNNNIINDNPSREAHGILSPGWTGSSYTGQNLEISCNYFWNNFVGLFLGWSGKVIPSVISCNMFSTDTFLSSGAIGFVNCYNNVISCNDISTQNYCWMGISFNTCDNNVISYNSIWATPSHYIGYGIYVGDGNCHGNTITGNTVQNAYMGIAVFGLDPDNPNLVYQNNFMNKPYPNAVDNSLIINNWDYNGVGNYWDDRTPYSGPYTIPGTAGAVDYSPLEDPYIYPNPPNTPTIIGPNKGEPGVEYYYDFVATDPNCDCIEIIVDWGDNTPLVSSGLIESGTPITLSHTWQNEEKYYIGAKAKNLCSGESDWVSQKMKIKERKN